MRPSRRWFACALALGAATLGCQQEQVAPAACYQRAPLDSGDVCALLGEGCAEPSGMLPAISEAITVVPSATMPAGVVSQTAHNNLDIAWQRGRLYFAFRTGPSHFASEEVVLYVVSTSDQQSWTLETRIALGKDLREPRFLTLGDRLILYFARLGEITFTFDPEAMMVTEQQGGCLWSEPRELSPTGEPGFIPWRAREIDGVGYLTGYVGGDSIYEGSEGTRVHWLRTRDGATFEPVAGAGPVLVGGASETDWAFVDGGGIVAVSRNEGGDDEGFGSKICRAAAGSLDVWECAHDPKKYDSPVVFRHDSEVYLIGRRQLANDGAYDLGMTELSHAEQAAAYQEAYWSSPKRCSLWKVDGETLSTELVMDLPSNGDTCFASVLPLSSSQYLVYNYSSPLDDPDIAWNDAQFGDTYIYRLTLTLP